MQQIWTMPHKGKTNETTIPLNNKNNVTSNYMYQKEWISETNIHEESKKNTSEEFPSSHMMESFKKDYQFAKMLYQSYPDHFVNTIEMLDKKNGGVVLVEKEDGEEIEEFLKIAIEMTKSLHFAHSKHIVHRDVKLANFVISSKSDSVKLIDFGLSVMVSRKSPSVSCTKPTDEKAMWNWILILKKKIDIEVKKIGGLKKFTNLKYTMEKDWVLLLNVMFESLDISFLAPSASRYVVLANSLVAYYLYLTRGLNENAVIGLSLCGMFCSFFFKENEGHELTLLAEQLFSQNKKPSFNVVSAHFHIGVGHITGGSFKQINYHMESGTRYAQNHGEYVFGGYTIWQSLSNFIFNGENLQVLLAKMKKYQAWLKKIKNYMMYDYTETFIQFVLDLSGVSEWNPQYLIPNIKTLKCADTLFPAMEGILNYHKGEYNEALRLFEISEPVIEHDKALIEYYEMKFYHCLTLIHIYKKSKNQKHLERAKQYVEEYQAFGRISSEYLEPRYKLMEVFYRSIDSTDIFTIADEMEDIIESTRKNGLVVIEAVTNEILLSFCDENNFQKGVCRMYFNNCFEIWRELSAVAKVEQLKKKYFKYISLIHSRRKSSTSSMPSSSNSTISNQSFGEPHMVDLENALLNNFNF
eukprot:gene4334-7690_t